MKKHLLCRGMLPFGALGENHSAAELAFVHPRLVRLVCGGGEKFLDTSCICDALCCAKNPSTVSEFCLINNEQQSHFFCLRVSPLLYLELWQTLL